MYSSAIRFDSLLPWRQEHRLAWGEQLDGFRTPISGVRRRIQAAFVNLQQTFCIECQCAGESFEEC